MSNEYKNYTNNIDEAFNYTCFDYLRILRNEFKKVIDKNTLNSIEVTLIKTAFDQIFPHSENEPKYNKNIPYGDNYTKILALINQNISILLNTVNNNTFIFHHFIKTIYENNNIGLEIANECFKNNTHTERSKNPINKISPPDSENDSSRANSVVGKYYWAMLTTCIPNVKQYENQAVKVIRHGTQAISVGNKTIDIYNTYKAYQEVLKHELKEKPKSKVSAIYFNLLKRSQNTTNIDPERERETTLTNTLEKNQSGIAIITLPADEGFLSKEFLTSNKLINIEETKKEFLSITKGNKDDFYIPDHIKKLIPNYESKIEKLFDDSLTFLGLNNKKEITEAERHALMFHFIKYEVTNFLIEELKPANHINFTCKDAIDRGATHDLYYHTIKSIKNNKPISDEDFNKYLHAASIQVKGRKLNKHLNYLANAISVRLNTDENYTTEYIKKWAKDNTLEKKISSKNNYKKNTYKLGFLKKTFYKIKKLALKVYNFFLKPKEYKNKEISIIMASSKEVVIKLDESLVTDENQKNKENSLMSSLKSYQNSNDDSSLELLNSTLLFSPMAKELSRSLSSPNFSPSVSPSPNNEIRNYSISQKV